MFYFRFQFWLRLDRCLNWPWPLLSRQSSLGANGTVAEKLAFFGRKWLMACNDIWAVM